MNGIFDPTQEELEQERMNRLFNAADYSFVTIPEEVKRAYRNIGGARLTLDRLAKYRKLSPGMKYDRDNAAALLSLSETIVRRFFATCSTDEQTGIPK